MEQVYDLIVIGAGPGGYPAALKAAAEGKKTALIEKRQLGGTCLNRGCIPTKTLLHSTGLYREVRQAAGMGVLGDSVSFEETAMWNHKDSVVKSLQDGIAQNMKKQKVDVYYGTGRVASVEMPVRVLVETESGTTEIKGERILLAVGAAPSALPIPGMELEEVRNSDQLLEGNRLGAEAGTLPEQMVIIGGGVIGMEMATVYSSLGCQVTVLEAMDRILPGMDKEISQNLKMILKKRGVEIVSSASVTEIVRESGEERTGADSEKRVGGGLICRYSVTDKKGAGQIKEVKARGILVSVGRRPETGKLFTPEVEAEAKSRNVISQRGFLLVNENFQMAFPGIYAIGDGIGGIQLAHVATAEGYRAVEHMFGLPFSQDLEVIPSCVYTDPEIACTGLTADQAKQTGIEAVSGKYIMSLNGKSVLTGQERGFVKLVAEKETGRLLGAQLMCARATDMIGTVSLAIEKGMTAADLASVVMPHPTFGEGIGEAAMELKRILEKNG